MCNIIEKDLLVACVSESRRKRVRLWVHYRLIDVNFARNELDTSMFDIAFTRHVSPNMPDVFPFKYDYLMRAHYIYVETPKPNPPYTSVTDMYRRYNLWAKANDAPLIHAKSPFRPRAFNPYRTIFWFCTGLEQAALPSLQLPPWQLVPVINENSAVVFLWRALFRFRDIRPPIAYPVNGTYRRGNIFGSVCPPHYASHAIFPSVCAPDGLWYDGRKFLALSMEEIRKNPEILALHLPMNEWELIWSEIKDVYMRVDYDNDV